MAQELSARWAHLPPQGWLPKTETERRSALDQLERMLAHPLFAHSKRYPALFRHVVERSLEGHTENLKERALGMEVFGRQADYDTNLDPVVRITAGEIRKRIAQYYHEDEHESELRIDLPAGSYVPVFHPPPDSRPAVLSPDSPVPAGLAQTAGRNRRPRTRSLPAFYFALFCAAAVGAAFIVLRPWAPEGVVNEFWGPVLNSQGPVLLSIGQPNPTGEKAGDQATIKATETVSDHILNVDHIVLSDATALLNLSGFLGKSGRTYRLQGTASTTLTDLRQGPTILISGFDNAWTLRLTEHLRFHFTHQANSQIYSIEDRDDSNNRWSVDFSMPYSKLTEDYAIVARYLDPTTDQVVVIAAGVGGNGTISAGELLTDERFLRQIADHGPKDWARKNVEAVVATQVIDEKSGPPRVAAVHFW